MDFAISTQNLASQALLLLRAAGYDDALYEGRRTGVSGHIISVSDDPQETAPRCYVWSAPSTQRSSSWGEPRAPGTCQLGIVSATAQARQPPW